jgi:hypothetical protein
MSLYNMLFGVNPLSEVLLGLVGLSTQTVGRFRDCYVEFSGDRWLLCVYTRNGGGNRECWNAKTWGAREEGCNCTGCIASLKLPEHPLYVSDEDDDFDNTYATFYFAVPKPFWPFIEELTTNSSPESKPKERWANLLAKIESAPPGDPDVQNAMQALRPVFEKISEALNKTE